MDKSAAQSYLSALLNKQLLVHTTDARMFAGDFKCTDNERNIILARAYEYRLPSISSIAAAAAAGVDTAQANRHDAATTSTVKEGSDEGPVVAAPPPLEATKVNMTSRYMGLVVVPGKYVVKIEHEERPWKVQAEAEVERRGRDGAGDGLGE